jgi:hypothetical protein
MGNSHSCCGVKFASEEQLVQHQVEDHGKEHALAGQCCNMGFYTNAGLQEHLRLHHGVKSQAGGK